MLTTVSYSRQGINLFDSNASDCCHCVPITVYPAHSRSDNGEARWGFAKNKIPTPGAFLTFTNPLLWVRGKVEICHRLENVQSTSGVIFSVKCPTYSPTIAQPDIQYTAVRRYSL